MKLLLKYLALFVGLALATPALAFSYSCADWKDPQLMADFWKEATPATIADCVQDMGFVMGFSVKDRDDFGSTPLFYAAGFATNPDVVVALIEAGADVNSRNLGGNTSLCSLLISPDPDIITALIKAGANANAKDYFKRTPLHYAAARNRNTYVFNVLIAAGADVNARDEDGATPLHWAAWKATDPEVINLLIEAGADDNLKNFSGQTPLHWAAAPTPYSKSDENSAWGPNIEVITALIGAGADASIEDAEGRTPFNYAHENEAIKNTDAYWALNEARFK